VYRWLVLHNLVVPEVRRKKRSDYVRWERSNAMELWQMDIVGGVQIAGGNKAKIVSGIDDHSRFVISGACGAPSDGPPDVRRVTKAMRTYRVPQQILTDNGKVFTSRFGPGTGEVLFDRICRENGINHILTAPRSPTTTGKVERWHKRLRNRVLEGKVFASVEDAQAQLDAWVEQYNHVREHQSLGNVAPIRRFELRTIAAETPRPAPVQADPASGSGRFDGGIGDPARVLQWHRVLRSGVVSGRGVARRPECSARVRWRPRPRAHRGVVTHARKHAPAKQTRAMTRAPTRKPARERPSASVVSVTRKVDSSGNVCFAAENYYAGVKYRRRQVQVAVVGDTIEISLHRRRTHPPPSSPP
jgi:transposase InsO family protein